MTQDRDALILERDALAAVVAEQKRVIGLMACAIVASKDAFMPNLEAITKAASAIEVAGKALIAAGLNEL